jgi:putative ABC transport system permease protein
MGSRTFSVSDVRAVLAGSLVQNRARTVVAALAIALGVALGFAVQLVNESAVDELTQSVRTLSGDADLTVRGPRGGFDEALYARLARDPEVAVASPAVEVEVRIDGRTEPLRVLGVDPFRTGAIQPGLIGAAADRMDTLRPDSIFLSNAASAWLGSEIGDTVTLQAGLRDVRLRVAGNLVGAGQPRLGVMDIAAVQTAFDRTGLLTRIDLRLTPGVQRAAARDRLARMLPPGVAIDQPEATSRATERISRSYRINLNVLALVALFTGGLLVFSTQALSTVRRRGQFALLRTLGMTRRRLAALCALEGALIGVVGSTLGVAAGYAIALAAIRIVGVDLGSGYFRGVAPGLDVDPLALAAFFLLGVAAATLGSLVPALEAARASPARALKAGDEETALDRWQSPVSGLVAIALGLAIVMLPPVDGVPLFGYAAIACLLIGTLLLMPVIARVVLAQLRPPVNAPATLAIAQLRSAPGQASISLASIVASVSLMVSMAIMVTSFRQSLEEWLGNVLPASLYARVPASEAAFTPDDQARIRALPGVARVEFLREEHLLLDASRPRVVLLARPLIESEVATRLPLVDAPLTRPAGAPPPVWVNEAMVDLYGHTTGKIVTLPIAGSDAAFFVAGVWRDYGRPQGAVQIGLDRYVALTGDRSATTAALWLAPDADLASVRDSLHRALPGGDRVELATAGEIRALSLAAFDRTFAVTYALEFAGVAIGLVGLSSAFGALVLARRREFGVLRHLGMTKRQIGAMLATEGLVTSALGVAAGQALGFCVSLILIDVLNRQSFHWGMEISVPSLELTMFAGIVVALATLTAVASGRQAMADDVVRAVKEDW